MKWLKKMAKWLKADEVYEIEEIVLKDNEQLDLQELENRGVKIKTESESEFFNKKKQTQREPRKKSEPTYPLPHAQENGGGFQDIDAKVSYQYPKGVFRFPVIPDYMPGERRKPKARPQIQPAPSGGRRERKPVKELRLTQEEPTRKERPGIAEAKQQEVKKRPYVPTEIPSPIYGFQKRPLKEMNNHSEAELTNHAAVEYELKSGYIFDEQIPAVYRKQVELEEKNHPEPVEDHPEQIVQPKDNMLGAFLTAGGPTASKPTGLPADQENSAVLDEVPILNKQENPGLTEEEAAPASAGQPETAMAATPSSMEEMMDAPAVFHEPTVKAETNIQHSNLAVAIEQENNKPALSVDGEEKQSEQTSVTGMEISRNSVLEPPIFEPAMPLMNETVPQMEESEVQETATHVMQSDGLDFCNETMKQTSAAVEAAPIEAAKETVAEPEEPVETPAKETKRKHIPFNVVMLRQDRDKIKTKKENTEKKTLVIDKAPEQANDTEIFEQQMAESVEPEADDQFLPYYQFPPINLLTPSIAGEKDAAWLDEQGAMLNETLFNFNVRASVVNITQGPSVTQFEVQPEPGVKVNKITNLTDDIKLCLAAQDIRMEAPIPGKHTIGIEIPNRKSRPVFLREILENPVFTESESPLTAALGLDITGAPIVTDLRKMPHGLIAGATGSGKSVCINTMIVSLLYKATPQELKLLLIDPKMVELAPYNSIPHLVSPVITDVKAATAALKWAVDEMERRYELFAHTGVRDITRFNKKAEEAGQLSDKLPFIVIIIDELADLMMMSPAEVEESICRIAQKARACGIHLIVATQRPSVDVITGLIKANIPTRIAFSVSSQIDSRTIIDSSGAEKLLGRGDMLFLENGSSKTVRLQGTFVSDEEIEEIVDFVRKEQEPQYLFQQEDLLAKAQVSDERDELFMEACEFVVYQNGASTSSLQRRFHIGYNRAARLIDMMESCGIISEARGSKPREVLMTAEDMEEWLEQQAEQL